jgi:phosphatidate cytidylyltransferase
MENEKKKNTKVTKQTTTTNNSKKPTNTSSANTKTGNKTSNKAKVSTLFDSDINNKDKTRDDTKTESKNSKVNSIINDGVKNITEVFNQKRIDGIKNTMNTQVEKIKSIQNNENFIKTKKALNTAIEKNIPTEKIKKKLGGKDNPTTRLITGLSLITAVGLMLFLDSFFVTWLALGVITYIAIEESAKLYKLEKNSRILHITAGAIWIMALFYPKPTDLLIVAIILFVSIKAFMKYAPLKEFYPILYPFAPMVFLLTLYINNGALALAWLIVTVAACDVAAYYIGRTIGKNKFCETSPNKTVEGVIGGIVVATMAGTAVGLLSYSVFLAFTVTFFVAIASIFGDLFESYLKRGANVKDSGDILPGHGGILDRVDGHLFGGIIMVILLSSFA